MEVYRLRVFVPSEAFDCTEIIFSPEKHGTESKGERKEATTAIKKGGREEKKGERKKGKKKVIAVNGFTGFPKNKRARRSSLFPSGNDN